MLSGSLYQQRTAKSVYNEQGKLQCLFQHQRLCFRGAGEIIALNDITGEMVHNEVTFMEQADPVLTHEIMNTVTPIASLSHTLSQEVGDTDRSDQIDWKELKLGLDTIASSSDGLIKFVNTYRSLTHVSAPVKKPFFVRD